MFNKTIFFTKFIFIFLISAVLTVLLYLNFWAILNHQPMPSVLLQIGSGFWLLGYFLIVSFSFLCLLKIIRVSHKTQTYFSLLMILIIFWLLIYRAGQTQNISLETTQAVACILNSNFLGEKFNSACFLGYPARAYLIQALPSIIFGRNLWTLNMGAVLIFFPGLIVFTYGLLIQKKLTKQLDLLLGFGLALLLNLYSVNHFLFFSFEQSIFPLSFSFMGLGLLIIYRVHKSTMSLLLLLFVVFMSIFSYTPSLSLLPIFFYYLFVNQFKIARHKIFWLMLFLTVAISSLYVSFQFRTDVRLKSSNDSWSQKIVSVPTEIVNITRTLIASNNSTPFINHYFGSILFLGIILSTVQKKHLLPFAWIFATFYFATTAKGYADYSLDFRVHRGLVVLPVVLILWVQTVEYFLSRFFNKVAKPPAKFANLILVVLFFVAFVTGMKNNFEFINAKFADDRQLLNIFMQNHVQLKEKLDLYIVDSPPHQNLISAQDGLQYFAPNVVSTQLIDQGQCSLSRTGLYLFTVQNACEDFLQKTGKSEFVGQYLDSDGGEKRLYKLY